MVWRKPSTFSGSLVLYLISSARSHLDLSTVITLAVTLINGCVAILTGLVAWRQLHKRERREPDDQD